MGFTEITSWAKKVFQACISVLSNGARIFGAWARVFLEATIAVAVYHHTFYEFEITTNPPDRERLEAILVGMSAALTVAMIEGVWNIARTGRLLASRVDQLTNELTKTKGEINTELISLRKQTREIEYRVDEDERIILARPELRTSRKMSVVAIEKPDHIPHALKYPPQCKAEKWVRSYSILRFDRLQDLLFSESYLEHFFALRRKAKVQNRILIVNDKPRSIDAIRSLLVISEQLRINTFVYKKKEFYDMLNYLPEVAPTTGDATKLKEILEGNPELNLMTAANNQFRNWTSGAVTVESDFVLRYLASNPIVEIVERAPGPRGAEIGMIPFRHVVQVLGIMSAAAKKPRLGLKAFEPIATQKGLPENFWSPGNLSHLKNEWERL